VEEKYNLPLTHEAFQDLTLFELSIWFWEDYYQKYPLEAKREGGEHVQFYSEDPLIDKWERELAQGLQPDLTEGMSPQQRERERRALARMESKHIGVEKAEQAGGGFEDDYSLQASTSQLPVIGKGTNAR
jgi:hypothetical protein